MNRQDLLLFLALALITGLGLWMVTPAPAAETASTVDWTGVAPPENSGQMARIVVWPVVLLLGLSAGAVVLYRKAAAAPVFIRHSDRRRKPQSDPLRHAPVNRQG